MSFENWSNLYTAYIGDSVITIHFSAFGTCSNLKSVYIGKNVTTISGGAFAYCTSLKCIFFNGEKEPTFRSTLFFSLAFDNVPSTTVMVPSSYSGDEFEEFEVIRDTKIEGCENDDWGLSNIKTETFTQSNTFSLSNTFTKSNLFTQSNTFTPSNAFSQSNTYTKSNTFIPSNTFTNSNTYTKSNIFSQSSTFTESNTFFYLNTFIKPINSNSNFTISFLLTYSLTFTQTISYELIVTNSFTISLFESKYIYSQVEMIYYNYTIVQYSTYFTYFSNFYFIYQGNSFLQEETNENVIIIIVVVIIVIIIVIFIIIIMYIKRKQLKIETSMIETSKEEEINYINEIETIVPNSNIENDPFANDFQEDNTINHL